MQDQLRLRRAVAEDADSIRDLTRAAYAKWVPVIGREPLPMRADHARAVAEHTIIVCEDGTELLALVELIPAPDHLLIENLAVRPEAQGRGMGERLLREAEAAARTLGLAEMRLYTNAAFVSNLSYYARHGYEEYERRAVPPGSITVYMRKSL